MNHNPVLRESLEVFFGEGHGFPTYFYPLIILAPVEFLSLYLPSLDAQAWSGAASLFKVAAVAALLLIPYFALRVANQEFAPWRFVPVRRWVRERGLSVATVGKGQLAFFAVHVLLSLAVCTPFLIWAAAIARTAPSRVVGTFLLLLFYTLSYGVWGLASLVLWERRSESRQIFVRCFFFGLVLLTALFYLPINPVAFVLSYLGQQNLAPLNLAGWKWPASSVNLAFHLLLGGIGLAAYRWALRRESPA
jgi:hypothetical protein